MTFSFSLSLETFNHLTLYDPQTMQLIIVEYEMVLHLHVKEILL